MLQNLIRNLPMSFDPSRRHFDDAYQTNTLLRYMRTQALHFDACVSTDAAHVAIYGDLAQQTHILRATGQIGKVLKATPSSCLVVQLMR